MSHHCDLGHTQKERHHGSVLGDTRMLPRELQTRSQSPTEEYGPPALTNSFLHPTVTG